MVTTFRQSGGVMASVSQGGSAAPKGPFPFSDWTLPIPSFDTVKIYVSSLTGDDVNNSGLDPSVPVRTIAHAKTLLRPGFPDWMLLKKGELFHTDIGYWTVDGTAAGTPLNGRSPTERMVIWYYGDGVRPIVKAPTEPYVFQTGNFGCQNLYILGLNMQLEAHVPPYSVFRYHIYSSSFMNHVLVEDCKFGVGAGALYVGGSFTSHSDNVTFRRNQVLSIRYSISSQTSAVSFGDTGTFTVDGNTIADVGAQGGIVGYFDAIGGTIINNIVANVTSNNWAILTRGGGIVQNNVIVQCGRGIKLGNSYSGEGFDAVDGGVLCTLDDNLVTETGFGPGASGDGVGIWVENVSSGTCQRNVITRNNATGFGRSMLLYAEGTTRNSVACGLHNLRVRNNRIYKHMPGDGFQDWSLTLQWPLHPSPVQISNLTISGNDIQEPVATQGLIGRSATSIGTPAAGVSGGANRYWLDQAVNEWFIIGGVPAFTNQWNNHLHDTTSVEQLVTYPDPDRTLSDYMTSIGQSPATTAGFMAALLEQDRLAWNHTLDASRVVAYFKANFGL